MGTRENYMPYNETLMKGTTMNKTLAKALAKQLIINLAVATAGGVIIVLTKKALTPVDAS